jgi:putative phosphoribosyl transferase
MIQFRDREDAGRRLAQLLVGKKIEHPIVLGIPRGGVPVALEVARALRGELGVVVARKLRAPGQPELAIGAVSSTGVAYINHRLAEECGADERYLADEQARQTEEASRREAEFDGHRHAPVSGRTVIVVDDGIATGATAIAALRSMRWAGAKRVIFAVPVGPPETIETMRREADEVYCLAVEPDFFAIGQFYADFRPFENDEVRKVLDEFERGASAVQRRRATIRRDGVNLAALLAVPPGSGASPCVVFIHGLGSGKDSPRNTVIAERLLDAGFATLLFDLSGHGESDDDPRGDEAFGDDLTAVYNWVQAQPGIDATQLMLAGSSMGGVVAAEAVRGGRLKPPPVAVVLRAPPVGPGDLDTITTPTLVVVGSHDPLLATVEMAAAASPAARLSVIPRAGHLFEEPGALDEVLDRTVAFLQLNVRLPAATKGK